MNSVENLYYIARSAQVRAVNNNGSSEGEVGANKMLVTLYEITTAIE